MMCPYGPGVVVILKGHLWTSISFGSKVTILDLRLYGQRNKGKVEGGKEDHQNPSFGKQSYDLVVRPVLTRDLIQFIKRMDKFCNFGTNMKTFERHKIKEVLSY